MPLAQNNVQTVAITVRYQKIVLSPGKIKTVNLKRFLAFYIQVGLLLDHRKIEPTVSYELFLAKNIV